MWDWFDFSNLSDLGSRAYDWLGEGLSGIGDRVLSPDFLVPAALGVGGMYMQNRALKDAQTRQQNAVDQALANNQAFQTPVTDALQKMTFERSTPQVAQETNTLRAKLASGLDDFTTKAREVMPQEARTGRLSNDYLTGMNTMSAEEAARRARVNQAWANLTAPTQQQFEQGLRDNTYNTQIGNATSDADVLSRMASRDIARAGQPSGGQMLIGDLLKIGGGGLATNSLLKPKTKPAPVSEGIFRNA